MTKNKIHIAAVQETHITKDKSYMMDNYRIITAAASRSKQKEYPQGGCNRDTRKPTAAHNANHKTEHAIATSNPRSWRTKNAHSCSCDVCASQRTHGGRKTTALGDVKELRSKTWKRHLVICGGDANGELGIRNTEEENTPKRNIPIRK